jgi:predicted nucleotidyltransferase
VDSYIQLLRRMSDAGVRFVVIGGYAAMLHGSDLITQDLDLCSPMDEENLGRIIAALNGLHPTFRFHIKPIPLHEDAASLLGVRNLYLKTDLGFLDILGEVAGIGTFADVLGKSFRRAFHGFEIDIIDLDALIVAKQTANREKDKRGVMHLEAVRRARMSEGVNPPGTGKHPGTPEKP